MPTHSASVRFRSVSPWPNPAFKRDALTARPLLYVRDNMLPPSATKSMAFVSTTIITFLVITVAFSFVGMILARSFGAKSQIKRQAIFSLVTLCGLCLGAFYAMSKLRGG